MLFMAHNELALLQMCDPLPLRMTMNNAVTIGRGKMTIECG